MNRRALFLSPTILAMVALIATECFAMRLDGLSLWLGAVVVASVNGSVSAALKPTRRLRNGLHAAALAFASLLIVARTEGPQLDIGWLGMAPTPIGQFPIVAFPAAGWLGLLFTFPVAAPSGAIGAPEV